MSTNGGIPYNYQPNPYYHTTEFNGFTVKLRASITGLNPAHTYRLKLAVGNTKDYSMGSGVFLAANSFMLGNTLSIFACDVENNPQVYMKSDNNSICIVRPDIEKDHATVIAVEYFNEADDAINGVDYITPDGEPLPEEIYFPAGIDTVKVPFIIPDGATLGRKIRVALVPLYENAPQLVHEAEIVTASLVANAGPDIWQNNSNVFTMAASAILPPPITTGKWSVIGSADGVAIANEFSPTTTVTLDTSKRKTATLRWTVTDGDCSYYDDMEIKYEKLYLPINPGAFFYKN
jgi:hypothetical protein